MKAVVGAALALAFLTGPSLAQSAPSAPPPASPVPPDSVAPGAAGPPAQPPRDGRDRDARGPGDEPMWRHPMFSRSKAARFRIETGDLRLGIKCPEDEPMKTCADFALQVIDKIGSMPQR